MAEATKKTYLRPNAVDSLNGKNTGNNLGDEHFPTIHFEEADGDTLTIDLMLKGGGCENVGAQYSLPDNRLKAGPRPGRGAQGGAGRGATRPRARAARRASWASRSAATAARPTSPPRKPCCASVDDTNPDPELAALEERMTSEANQLGIGPMGFGGKTTVLGTKITATHRLPASFLRHGLLHVLGLPPPQDDGAGRPGAVTNKRRTCDGNAN